MRFVNVCLTASLIVSAASRAGDDSRFEYPTEETRQLILVNSARFGVLDSKKLEATLVRFESSDEKLSKEAQAALSVQEASQIRKSLESARSLVERSQDPLNVGQLEKDVLALRVVRRMAEAKISAALAPPKPATDVAAPAPKPAPATQPSYRRVPVEKDYPELKRGPGHLYLGP